MTSRVQPPAMGSTTAEDDDRYGPVDAQPNLARERGLQGLTPDALAIPAFLDRIPLAAVVIEAEDKLASARNAADVFDA